MSVHCIERFVIQGVTYGIEDMKDGAPKDQHFFSDNATHRYQLWRGGCGIGRADTLADARLQVHTYAVEKVSQDAARAAAALEQARRALHLLAGAAAFLFRFEAPPLKEDK